MAVTLQDRAVTLQDTAVILQDRVVTLLDIMTAPDEDTCVSKACARIKYSFKSLVQILFISTSRNQKTIVNRQYETWQ